MNRAVRNNNPLNIIKGAAWAGRTPEQPDPRFVTFKDAGYGYRAAWCLVYTYIKKGYDTIPAIIQRWCPDSTAVSYTNFVLTRLGVDGGRRLGHGDAALIEKLLLHMSTYEGYTADTLTAEVKLAQIKRGFTLTQRHVQSFFRQVGYDPEANKNLNRNG